MNTNGNGSMHYRLPETSPGPRVTPGILIETLRHHPVMILGMGIAALVAAHALLGRATPRYTSTARVYVEQEIPKVIRDSERGVMTKQDNYLYTQAEVLRSNPVLAGALALLNPGPMRTFVDAEDRLLVLHDNLETAVGKMDGIINISFKGPHPEEAAEIVNAVVDAYVAFHAEQKRDTAAALLKILEEARIHYDADVALKYQRLLEFRRQHESLAFGSDQTNHVVLRQMEQLLTQLSQAKVATRQVGHVYETARSLAEDSAALRQFLEARHGRRVDDTTANKIASLQAELTRLEGAKADVLLELRPEHPAIATLDAEIDRTREKITELDRQFVRGQLAVLEQEWVAAQQKEEELAAQCEAQRHQVFSLNDELTQYARLQSDYEEAKKSSGILDDRIKELSVTEAVGRLTVTILERATAARMPSEPRKGRLMAIAVLLGTCAGFGCSLMREVHDQRLRSSQEISALLRLPVLGVVPVIRSPLHSGIVRAQVVRICPTGSEAEAFRRLRTPFLLDSFNGHARTILVTSPVCGEGKTTVVSNLALSLAQAGQRVLIVDADCHTPKQHHIFKKNRWPKGLSSVVASQAKLEEAIESTGVDGLDLLTCGPQVFSPSEMLNQERFRRLLATLAGRYDRVLVDSPPVLLFSDAQILAAQCDGIILVLRAGTSTRGDSVQAHAELAAVGARILGVVVNAAPHRRGSHRENGCYRRRYSIETVPAGGCDAQAKGVLPLESLFERRS